MVTGSWKGGVRPPVLRSTDGAHGKGLYTTPSFRMAASYGYRDWDGESRHAIGGPRRTKFLAVLMLAVPKEEVTVEGQGTAFSHNNDDWDRTRIEWVIKDAAQAQVFGVLMCYFRTRCLLPDSSLVANDAPALQVERPGPANFHDADDMALALAMSASLDSVCAMPDCGKLVQNGSVHCSKVAKSYEEQHKLGQGWHVCSRFGCDRPSQDNISTSVCNDEGRVKSTIRTCCSIM